MDDFPKYFAKGDDVKVANNQRRVVELRFAGYKERAREDVEGVPAASNQEKLPLTELVEKTQAEGGDVAAAVESWETNGGATAKTTKPAK